MSKSFSCHCPERQKPVADRNWVIWQYRERCSAFDGYRHMASDYSHLYCKSCGASGRTKANYVRHLRTEDQRITFQHTQNTT